MAGGYSNSVRCFSAAMQMHGRSYTEDHVTTSNLVVEKDTKMMFLLCSYTRVTVTAEKVCCI